MIWLEPGHSLMRLCQRDHDAITGLIDSAAE